MERAGERKEAQQPPCSKWEQTHHISITSPTGRLYHSYAPRLYLSIYLTQFSVLSFCLTSSLSVFIYLFLPLPFSLSLSLSRPLSTPLSYTQFSCVYFSLSLLLFLSLSPSLSLSLYFYASLKHSVFQYLFLPFLLLSFSLSHSIFTSLSLDQFPCIHFSHSSLFSSYLFIRARTRTHIHTHTHTHIYIYIYMTDSSVDLDHPVSWVKNTLTASLVKKKKKSPPTPPPKEISCVWH